ncbi:MULTISPECIES: DUF4382 domain-containing protein [Haloarcula]|uniref:DUF4382 domain-containing protein n=1 Tax=Haloarcula TaxID=2237 RepID=UPI0023EB6224|nr:DUF4382 domain-containing protein [Halomicroarcula sp. XH51]
MDRRKFLGTTTAIGATLVAGCGGSSGDGAASDGGSGDGTSSTESDGGAAASTGTFRLLISDRPADIGDFDSLDVTFDSARVFRVQSDEDDEVDSATTATEAPETEAPETETEETTTETATTETEGESADEAGFQTFDLDSPTVDLTEVVGAKAIGVLDGELETGRYAKVELSVAAVEGVVDGETVPVKVPSEKLQITKPFEVTAEAPVEFVFDINVVKKGPNGYNLLPVISESGVAGKDVEIEEVESTASASSSAAGETGTDADATTTVTETEGDDAANADTAKNKSRGPSQSDD